jgi:hypothetical protein
MARFPLKFRLLALLGYAGWGLSLGFADPYMGRLAQAMGTKPGVATAVSVNVLLPFAAVVLGLVVARVGVALVGAAAMTAGFIGGLAAQYGSGLRDASLVGVLGSIPLVLVLATIGYGVLGVGAAIVGRAWRKTPAPNVTLGGTP